jgi:hypothetical protein
MIDFTTIAFTEEESKEIAELEATAPDKAHFLKTHIALERMGFMGAEYKLVNDKGERLADLLAGWESEECDDSTPNTRMTFVQHWLPPYKNVVISYRKQSEKATNSFTIRIKE